MTTAASPYLKPVAPAATPRAVPAHDSALDGMRFIALVFVTIIHVAAKGFGQLGHHWWAVNAYESVSRVAVPLFFMISGALLLPRQQTIGAIGKRLWRIAVPLLGWSVLYLCWFRYTGDMRGDWLKRIVHGPVVAHLWYLYALAGAYLFLPVMAGFYQATAVRVQVFTLVFWFLGACVIPWRSRCAAASRSASTWLTCRCTAAIWWPGRCCTTTCRRGCRARDWFGQPGWR
ncbi:acyltransferase [Pseudoduganella armeniaca]|uniref:Acyltransferase 3 domain-containing protein n=1 Tax=Pseudoduganella armeniaca TaxID=2072590 RepID=A0A2R4CFI3_9BURK|nr:acyltransferase family protein [Pseudoduganella armeniaca]AVR98407.1 hypothetical protein C9I28_24275 [Pseudoduganella armeniaca]